MESMRRFLNPLVLNLQKMELELTCPVCMCATTRTANGYSCAICKAAYLHQDLRPASHLEAIVSIHRSLSSTVNTMLTQQDTHVDVPVAKTTPQGTPESGTRSGVDKSDQMKSYNHIASKLVYSQSTGPAFGNMDGVQGRDSAFVNKTADAAVAPSILVQKGHSGSQSSDGPGDLDCDSNDLQGELITSRSAPQSALKREPNVMDDHARELKRQKSIDQGENVQDNDVVMDMKTGKPSMAAGSWKCEFCHSSKITEFTGPLSHYLHGEPLEDDQAWKSNVLHVHEKCIEWAPQAYFTGDVANNLEPELARASKIKCSVCGLKGAALGCLVRSCRKSYHVPCAHQISGCRWDEEIVDQFEQQTGMTVINNWWSNVTHVIANTDEHGAWLKACLEAGKPVPEEPYEINCDVHGSFDGPRTGRLRAMQQAPSLFAGLTFYFSGNFMPGYKVHLEDLIAAAGGSIVEKTELSSTSLIIYSMEPPQGSDPNTLDEVIKKRMAAAEEQAAAIGCKALPHTWILDSIASCTILIRSHAWMLRSAAGGNAMAFFNSGSRALVEILTRMQSAERPMPVDHTFFEFGSIRYHVEASASDSENVYLSISTPSLSHEASPSSSGLPEITLQETRKTYHKFAVIVEPPREGYVLTLKLNFSGLTRPKDRIKAINQVSRLQSVVLSSQLKDMLGRLGRRGRR
ncbi:hypothetical protein EJB05_38797 [Eragrostis curvula]|uniref:Arp2/3 complex 34 kDa subunit n=1 Tax=Eragrostis curvula TaxID=38414 RepID=A0A5J9TVG0_9POAL|nr:hypothetical protein EJB05_38797 [Eragrostis curvula]